MKMNMTWGSWLSLAALTLFGCQGANGLKQGAREQADEAAADDDLASSLIGEEGDADGSSSAEEVEQDGEKNDRPELSDEAKAVLETAHKLGLASRKRVAECGGFLAEFEALGQKLESLKEAGIDRKDAFEEVKDLDKAVREKIKANKDTVKGCIEKEKDTSEMVALKQLMDSCFVAPKRGGGEEGIEPKGPRGPRPPRDLGEHEGKRPGLAGQGGHAGPRPQFLPPPVEFATFDKEECKAAVTNGEEILGS